MPKKGVMRGLIQWLEAHSQRCFYRENFGFECLGCGLQRALVELLRGNFWESFLLFPALVPLLFLFVLYLVYLFFPTGKLLKILRNLFVFDLVLVVVQYFFKLLV